MSKAPLYVVKPLAAAIMLLIVAQEAFALPIPSLDEMAGDWIAFKDVANPPAVHNFNQMLVVDRDLTFIFCNPGELYPWRRGYPIVKLSIDATEYPATENSRRYAYRALRRNLDCGGITVETDTRMVNEQRGVLCRVTFTNATRMSRRIAVALRMPGSLQPDGVGVANNTQHTGVVSIMRPSRKPESVAREGTDVGWKWAVEVPRGGTTTLGFVVGDGPASQSVHTDAQVSTWAEHSTPGDGRW